MDLQQLVRKNIWGLKPYSSARDEFKGEASVYLDANENPLRDKYNRYPDPLQKRLKERIFKVKQIASDHIFLGNGSDEPIDVVIRVFCEPGVDNVVAIDPTYGMYEVCANINNVEYRKVLLTDTYSLDADRLLNEVDDKTKLVFLCSPNNPTGNLLEQSAVEKVLRSFKGIVVLDEAYIDFAEGATMLHDLSKYPNLVILQTFSKAWGLAAVRLGMAFASPDIIAFFNKVKYPYNVNELTQEYVYSALEKEEEKKAWVEAILKERGKLMAALPKLSFVEHVCPTDSNFVLVKVSDANAIYNQLAERGVIVRNRSKISLCDGCLRITIGTEKENEILIESLKNMSQG